MLVLYLHMEKHKRCLCFTVTRLSYYCILVLLWQA